ncbi:MAG: UDP-N-acetylmuramoyl-L-alanyl-D-glutamate--2,6-diaminopimelate ligase [Chloroflexi bacterium]|uniref:UDP-N-acetylmuramyl-tripeptide synthetase n=1 Tax=Candidatus Chlorohelix allophototropha TaxID=3003348 RepID=A0A8T7MAH0_9CHLR|nr:UDP-N-acetylmuramoyl-L-alanyl-D-glutamate--2,6-diaminopimelate ligase [Chloroflexota bacterium]
MEALPSFELLSHQSAASNEITSVVYSSREVTQDALFVAVVGFHTDGHFFIADALSKGATAIVGTNRAKLENYLDSAKDIAFILVEDERTALAHLTACLHDYPAQKLGVIGVTGTDGKTTTTFLISALLDAACLSNGLMGTVDFKIGSRRWSNATRQTTPEAAEVQSLLSQMVTENIRYAILESTSHALALRKLVDCFYDIAVLTNITHEHLEFHDTFENYRLAKSQLFSYLNEGSSKPFLSFPKTAIVNADDPHAGIFREAAGDKPQHLTYGIKNRADVFATDIYASVTSLEYTLNTPKGLIPLKLKLAGDFNVYNSLAAASVGLVLGISLEQIKAGLESVSGVPGRMEVIEEGQPFSVIVDYAHTPESLAKVLNILRPLTSSKLIVVFGSAGERDRAKRPMQGAIAATHADFAVFTNEDPRLEDENFILDEIAAGAETNGWHNGQQFLKIPDRRTAIEAAFSRAKAGDTVLLAGKGHEQSIIIGTEKVPWDERDAARAAIKKFIA